MARYTGPKFKLDRREGANLFLKGKRSLGTKHPIEKKGAVPPGQHGQKLLSRRKISDYARQLREKQKVKRIYGVLENQFKRYFNLASKKKAATGEFLLTLLETRLDNVVYKLGFAVSRAQARQLVNHGHVLVNDKKVSIPSYNIKAGDLISLKKDATNFASVKEAVEMIDKKQIPDWLVRKGLIGKVNRIPVRDDTGADVDEQLIVEFYSR